MKTVIDQKWPESVKELIRLARGGASQKRFAEEIGVSQSSMSKYEAGNINPPTLVIDACLSKLRNKEKRIPNASDLAKKLVNALDGPEHVGMRRIVEQLLSGQFTVAPGRPRKQNRLSK